MSDLNLTPRAAILKELFNTEMKLKEGTKGTFVIDKTVYMEQLPEELSKEIIKAKEAYDRDFIAAATLVGGEKATEAMVADKSLTAATVDAPMSADTLKVGFARHKSGPIAMGDQKGGTWNSYCHPTVTVKTKAAAKSSQLGRVISHLKTQGEAKLK